MSFGVDTLGGLAEKLKQLINDTQNLYEAFIDANQLYKQGKMGDKEFFTNLGEYLISTSALNFLAVRVILEIKNAMEKGTSIKSPTGGSSSSPSPPQAGFGIGGFVGTGAQVGPAATVGGGNDYTLPLPGTHFQACRYRITKTSGKLYNNNNNKKKLCCMQCINTSSFQVLQQVR